MSLKCSLGYHSWNGCKCSVCGKIRDDEHNWLKDCEICSVCGTTRENFHDWNKDCEKCSVCGITRNSQHDWSKNCEKCAMCGTARIFPHIWDGCKCSKCSETRDEGHLYKRGKCTVCSLPIEEMNFKTVKIGNYFWMIENLNVDKFSNGDKIPEIKTIDEWRDVCSSGKPAWCYYWFESIHKKEYGKLYNRHAILDQRGLAPLGWHIPTLDEFQNLLLNVDNSIDKLQDILEKYRKSKVSYYNSFNTLFAGSVGKPFYGKEATSNLWSSSKNHKREIYYLYIHLGNYGPKNISISESFSWWDGYSVRLVRG